MGTSYIPTATSFVKSGVIATSVTRMGVRPHESRCFPSASCVPQRRVSLEDGAGTVKIS